jgi:hypothetical protein
LFEGVIAPTSDTELLEIRVTLTAANLRGECIETFKLDKQVIPVQAEDLIDLRKLTVKQGFPLQEEVKRSLLDLERRDEIEWDDNDDDD